MSAIRISMIGGALFVGALATMPAQAADPTSPARTTATSTQTQPLYVPPPGDTQGRRRWLSHVLNTPGEFSDHQVAEFKANIAAMSPDEVKNVKYTDAKIADFKTEVARMKPNEVRQLLSAWRRDSKAVQQQGVNEAERRKQEVATAVEQQKRLEWAEEDRRKFRVNSTKISDQRVAEQRDTARREAANSQRDWLDSRSYDPYGGSWWNSYNRQPWHRPYYGPYR
jgi:hypothetical protein